jgi:hypothetical protein
MAKDPHDTKTLDLFVWLNSLLIVDYNDGSY